MNWDVTPLELFTWAVVRQSSLGPGLQTAAEAFGIPRDRVRFLVNCWKDPRGHMEVIKLSGAAGYRIEAYYNTSAP